MYVSDWTPPKASKDNEAHIHGGGGDSSVFHPLMALVVAVFLAVATMFACDYASNRSACAAHVSAQQC